MTTFTDVAKKKLWSWYGSDSVPAEWDGRTYGGGKISQRFWEYFIGVELLALKPPAVVLDIGGGSPANGLSLFPRLLAESDAQVIVMDTNFGPARDAGPLRNVTMVEGLATRDSLSQVIRQYKPDHITCMSVLEHASREDQVGIFEAIEAEFTGKSVVMTFEFHETNVFVEQMMTTPTLSAAVSKLNRYYLDRIERSPVNCVNAIVGGVRQWFPLALRFSPVIPAD